MSWDRRPSVHEPIGSDRRPPFVAGVIASWVFLLLGGLVLAVTWDADGDPGTENLPAVVLTADERHTSHAERGARRGDALAAARPADGRWIPRWLRTVGELLWRPTASPARGP